MRICMNLLDLFLCILSERKYNVHSYFASARPATHHILKGCTYAHKKGRRYAMSIHFFNTPSGLCTMSIHFLILPPDYNTFR
jgi:hypothetical protein